VKGVLILKGQEGEEALGKIDESTDMFFRSFNLYGDGSEGKT